MARLALAGRLGEGEADLREPLERLARGLLVGGHARRGRGARSGLHPFAAGQLRGGEREPPLLDDDRELDPVRRRPVEARAEPPLHPHVRGDEVPIRGRRDERALPDRTCTCTRPRAARRRGGRPRSRGTSSRARRRTARRARASPPRPETVADGADARERRVRRGLLRRVFSLPTTRAARPVSFFPALSSRITATSPESRLDRPHAIATTAELPEDEGQRDRPPPRCVIRYLTRSARARARRRPPWSSRQSPSTFAGRRTGQPPPLHHATSALLRSGSAAR